MLNMILYLFFPLAAIGIGLTFVRLWTAWEYFISIRRFTKNSPQGGPTIVTSPQIPYWLPFLGNTTSFLTTKPKSYWKKLFKWHIQPTGVFTLLIGGRKTHILYSPTAVQALFKAKSPVRDIHERELFAKVFDMPPDQIDNCERGKHFEHESNSQYLLNFIRVNELTAHFTKVLDEKLSQDAEEIVKIGQIGLFEWLRDRMFTASTTALMGERLLEMYPSFCQDFFAFDADFLSFMFGLPDFVLREPLQRKRRIMDKLETWSAEMHRLSGGQPVNPEHGPAWEPLFGSRLNRVRHIDYKKRQLNVRSSAALDLGIVFAISSNVIPATGWMLLEILSPHAAPTLLPRVLAEIDAATNPDLTLDIAALMQKPLLQSIWTETLRFYVDVVVTRNLPEDIILPLDEDRKRLVSFKKGDMLFAIQGIDPKSWTSDDMAPDVWYSDRFLVRDPKTGKDVFNSGRTAGKIFPFGGGKTICPGRHFAKQEALGALAMILLRFEFDVVGFVDSERRQTQEFPGFAKAFPGSGALTPGGDMMVRIKKKDSASA